MRGPDLQATNVLLEEQRDGTPVGMRTYAMGWDLLGGVLVQSRIVHEFEIVKVRLGMNMLRGKVT
jgi:hypothetical protein